MRFLKSFIAVTAAAVMLVPAFSCGKHESYKDDSEIEQELERKYGVNFTLVSDKDEEYKTDDDKYVYFKDDKGVEFRVDCHREFNIVADSKVQYSEWYIKNYLEKYGDELISELKADGLDARIDRNVNIALYIDSYYDIDDIYEKLKDHRPFLIPPEDNYIGSNSEVILYHSGDEESIGAIRFGKAVMQEKYVKLVRYGDINEKLPEEIMRKYPEEFLGIVINGKNFYENKDASYVKAHYLKDDGRTYVDFKGNYEYSQKYIREYLGLEKFIKAVTGESPKEVFDTSVIYEDNEIQKPAEHYYEWSGGTIDLIHDEDLDITNERLRLYEDDIERIFGVKVSSDPVNTGILTIDKQ